MTPWQKANLATGNVDPSAGVVLMPRAELCPRCGCSKGRRHEARPGLCADCRSVLAPAERAAWAA